MNKPTSGILAAGVVAAIVVVVIMFGKDSNPVDEPTPSPSVSVSPSPTPKKPAGTRTPSPTPTPVTTPTPTATPTPVPGPTQGKFNLRAGGYSVNEGAGTALITITRTVGTTGEVSVRYRVATDTAGTADFVPLEGIINFSDGQSSATFSVTVYEDSTHEPDETAFVTLFSATGGAELGTDSAVLTIVDNDPASL